MNVAATLNDALNAAGFPVIGVSMGVIEDKRTWRLDWDGVPSNEALAAAQAIVEAFDPAAVPKAVDPMRALADALVRKGVLTTDDLPEDLKSQAKARTWTEYLGLDGLFTRA